MYIIQVNIKVRTDWSGIGDLLRHGHAEPHVLGRAFRMRTKGGLLRAPSLAIGDNVV